MTTDGVRIFVHNTALRSNGSGGKRRSLLRGTTVTFEVGSNAKGPMAVDVEVVAVPAAPSETALTQKDARCEDDSLLDDGGDAR